MMLMDSSEELVAEEHMPEQDHVDSRKISLDVINLDPLPRENMILEGAEQGGITDVRKTRRIIVATTVVFLILLGSLIGVILKMKQVRNADQLAVMDNDFIDNTATSTGIWNLTTITTPGSTFMDDDSGPNNDPLDDISSIKARRDAILLKLYEVSGEDTINDKGSAQYAAANWSAGMLSTSCGVITNIASVPTVPVLSSPWHIPPKSLPKAVCHVSAVTGSFISFL